MKWCQELKGKWILKVQWCSFTLLNGIAISKEKFENRTLPSLERSWGDMSQIHQNSTFYKPTLSECLFHGLNFSAILRGTHAHDKGFILMARSGCREEIKAQRSWKPGNSRPMLLYGVLIGAANVWGAWMTHLTEPILIFQHNWDEHLDQFYIGRVYLCDERISL